MGDKSLRSSSSSLQTLLLRSLLVVVSTLLFSLPSSLLYLSLCLCLFLSMSMSLSLSLSLSLVFSLTEQIGLYRRANDISKAIKLDDDKLSKSTRVVVVLSL
jgi:hypothetical protein